MGEKEIRGFPGEIHPTNGKDKMFMLSGSQKV